MPVLLCLLLVHLGYRLPEVIVMKTNQKAKNDVAQNSSMAEDMKEMKNLGKEVEQMKTNEELKKDNKVQDRLQETNSDQANETKEKIEQVKSKHRLLDAKF
ncbi:hypothetical protein [Bacillus coreaensis]